MKRLIFMSVAALGLAATPALAANAYWSGSTPMSFGPSELRTQGILSTPYPQVVATARNTDADSDYLQDHEIAPSARASFSLGDMDSDTDPSTIG